MLPRAAHETHRRRPTAIPDSKATFHTASASGNTVVLEVTWHGTHTGPLQIPGGDIAPTSRKDVFDVTGDFTMHGITKQITVPVEVLGWQNNPQGERVGFSLNTTVNRKDYGVLWNRALDNGGFMLGDDVEVNVAVEAVKQTAPPTPPTTSTQPPPATSTH